MAHLRYTILADAQGGYTVEVRSGSAVVEVVSGFPNEDRANNWIRSSGGGILAWLTGPRVRRRMNGGVWGMRGTVKFFNIEKGFGFVKPEGGGPDVFVHVSALVATTSLRENDEVEFEMGTDRRSGRPRAEKVRIV